MFKFFGIQIEKKTDILAFAAFLLATASIMSQVYSFFRGADVTLFPPEQIFIIRDNLGTENKPNYHVRFNVRMAYVNTGAVGYNAVIERETLSFTIVKTDGSYTYEQAWSSFTTFDLIKGQYEPFERAPANPKPINAGSAESHDTYFSPRSIPCEGAKDDCPEKWSNYLKWVDFLTMIKDVNARRIDFMLVGKLYGSDPVNASCTIYITPTLISWLDKDKAYSPSCRPKNTRRPNLALSGRGALKTGDSFVYPTIPI